MTLEIIDYPTRDLMKTGKTLKHSQGFRSLHTDFINNDESDGYRVTFVNGLDDPNNDPILVRKRLDDKLKRERDAELKQKAKDKDLSKTESDELLERLSELL